MSDPRCRCGHLHSQHEPYTWAGSDIFPSGPFTTLACTECNYGGMHDRCTEFEAVDA